MYRSCFKTMLDFLVSGTLLVFGSPVLILLSIWVWLKLGWPVFFTQERAGLNGKSFNIIKFRTMTDELDELGNLRPDGERLTEFGRWFRSYSLDEAPGLLNVIRGEMSLVGPRPLLTDYLHLYSSYHARRHEVMPGITGWAQVNGRNAITWSEKFDLDLWYVENQSFGLDCLILCKTFFKVLGRKNINASGHATTPPFKGEKNEGKDF
jgi:sugar transferase EpsL